MATKKNSSSTTTTTSEKEQYINAYINAAYNGASASEATQAARAAAMPNFDTNVSNYSKSTKAAQQLASGESYVNSQGRIINKSAEESYAKRVQDTIAQNSWTSNGRSVYSPAYQGNKTWNGNIDLTQTPVASESGSKTGKSYTYITMKNGKYVVIPGVQKVGDEWYQVDQKTALQNFRSSGDYYGEFDTAEEADNYAMQLYNYQKALTTGEDDMTGSWASKYDPDATRGYDYVGEDTSKGSTVKGMNTIEALGYGLIKGGADVFKSMTSYAGIKAADLLQDIDLSVGDYWENNRQDAKSYLDTTLKNIWDDNNEDTTETKIKDTTVAGVKTALQLLGTLPVKQLVGKGLNALIGLSTGTTDAAANQQAALDWADSFQTPDADRIYNAAVYNAGTELTTELNNGIPTVTEIKNDGSLQKTIADTQAVIGNMLPSILISYGVGGLSGAVAGRLEMSIQAAGSSAKQALENGASVEDAYYTGLEHGMLEYGTECLFGGIEALGNGVLSEGMKKVLGNFALTKAGRILGKIGDTLGENAEEGVSDYLGDNIDKVIYGYEGEESKADSTFLQAMLGQAPWTEEGLTTLLSTLILGATNNLISNGVQTIPKAQANELLDIARNTDNEQLKKLAEEYQREVDRRGKLGAERAQTVVNAIGPEAYAAETARRAEEAQAAQEQAAIAQNNAQVQADTVEGFINQNGLQSVGEPVQSTGINITRSDGAAATFDGLAMSGGQVMAKVTLQDGTVTYDSMDAVAGGVPAETAAFAENVISTFGEQAPAVYAMYDGSQSGDVYVAAMDEAINVYAANGVDVKTVAQTARTRAAEQTGNDNASASLVATLNDTQLEYAQSAGQAVWEAKQADAQTRTEQYTAARNGVEEADSLEEHGEGTIAETGRAQTLYDNLDTAFTSGNQVYESKRAEYSDVMAQLQRTQPGTEEYDALVQRANDIAAEGEELANQMQTLNERREEARKNLKQAKEKQEQKRAEREQRKKDREKARAEANKKRHGKRGTVSFDGGTIAGKHYNGVDASKLTAGQKKTVAAIEALTNAVSVDFVFFETDARDTQGAYVGNGKIYVNINSGMATGHSLGVLTVSHELTHMISELAPAQYLQLQKFVIENVTKDSQEAFERKIREAMDAYGYSRELAIEEYVAQGCTEMLENSKAIEKLARENMSLAEKIADILKEIVDRIKEAFAEAGGFRWAEARAMEKYAEQLQELWDDALIEAEHNLQAVREASMFEGIERNTEEADAVAEENTRFSKWEGEEPKKTQWGFKLMTVDENGKPHAMFIDNANAFEYGEWYKADSPLLKDLEKLEPGYSYLIDGNGDAVAKQTKSVGKRQINDATLNGQRWIRVTQYKGNTRGHKAGDTAYHCWGINGSGSVSTYALRPGLHFVDGPSMRHIGETDGGKKPVYRRSNQRWFLVEYPVDVDYNMEAYNNPTKDIPSHIPVGGWYSFQTNSGAEAKQHWFISGGMRIIGGVSEADARQFMREEFGSKIGEDLPYKDGVKDFDESDSIDLFKWVNEHRDTQTPKREVMGQRIREQIAAQQGAKYQLWADDDPYTQDEKNELDRYEAEINVLKQRMQKRKIEAKVEEMRSKHPRKEITKIDKEISALQQRVMQEADELSVEEEREINTRLKELYAERNTYEDADRVSRIETFEANAKYQKWDEDYMAAVDAGDMKTAQAMVDQAAEDAGYEYKAYHATNSDFNVFDRDKLGEHTFGNAMYIDIAATAFVGHWFNENDLSKSLLPMKKSIGAYLKIEHPAYLNSSDLHNQLYEFMADEVGADEAQEMYEDSDRFEDARALARRAADSLMLSYQFRGKDGLIVDDEEFFSTSYVVFDSNQIKSADPVTYDDDGNVIPLSKRFDETNNDIRYQKWDDNLNEWNVHLTSKLETVLGDAKTPAKMAGNQVVNFLKGRGVTAEEIRWSGIAAYAESHPKVTRDELLQYARENSVEIKTEIRNESRKIEDDTGVDTQTFYVDGLNGNYDFFEVRDLAYKESEKRGLDPFSAQFRLTEANGDITSYCYYNENTGEILLSGTFEEAKNKAEDTKWGEYSLNGGKNYREILFSFPNSNFHNYATEAHWGENSRGIFAHARVTDQADTTGNKMLHIEEIQSDLHNQGTGKKGSFITDKNREYAELSNIPTHKRTPEQSERYEDLLHELAPSLTEYEELEDEKWYRDAHVEPIKDAIMDGLELLRFESIFVEDWMQGNRDTVTSARYSESGDEEAKTKEAYALLTDEQKAELEEYREFCKKFNAIEARKDAELEKIGTLIQDVPYAGTADSYTQFVLKNLLQMAAENGYDGITWTTAQQQVERWSDEYAEGYRIEYDQDIPKFLNKFGRQWGAKVEKTTLDNGDAYAEDLTEYQRDVENAKRNYEETGTREDADVYTQALTAYEEAAWKTYGDEVWAFYLTEGMKNGINAGEGMTKFQRWHPDQISMAEWLDEYDGSGNKLRTDEAIRLKTFQEIEDQAKAFFTELYGEEENWPISQDYLEEICFTEVFDDDVMIDAMDLIQVLFSSLNETDAGTWTRMFPVIKDALHYAPAQDWDLVFTDRARAKFRNDFPVVQAFRDWIAETDRAFGEPEEYVASNPVNNPETQAFAELARQKELKSPYSRGGIYPIYQKWSDQDTEDTAEESVGRATARVRAKTEQRIISETVAELNKTISKTKAEVEKEAKRLGVKVEDLLWELRTPAEATVREDDVKKLTNRLLKQYSSKADKAEVMTLVQELGNYIARSTGEGLSEEILKEHGTRIAEKILGEAVTVQKDETGQADYFKDIANEIKGARLFLAEQDRADLAKEGGYEAFRKSLFGKITLAKDGTPVDSYYKELQARFPNESLFPDASSNADMLVNIRNALNAAKELSQPILVNPVADFWDEAVEQASGEIIEQALNGVMRVMPQILEDEANARYRELQETDAAELNNVRSELNRTQSELSEEQEHSRYLNSKMKGTLEENEQLAGKNKELQKEVKKAAAALAKQKANDAKKLEKAMKKANERLERLRKQKNERIDEIRRQGTLKRQQAVAKERAKKWEAVKSVKDFYKQKEKEAYEARKENAAVKKLREDVKAKANKLYKWLTENSGKHHIPEALKKPVAELLLEIDFTSERALDGGEATNSDKAFAERMDEVRAILQKQIDAQNGGENVESVFNGYLDLPLGVLDNMQTLVNEAKAAAAYGAKYTVNDMDSEQLSALDQIISAVFEAAKGINTLHANSVYKNVDEAGQQTMEELGKKKPLSEKLFRKEGQRGISAAGVNDFLQWDNTVPVYAFRRYGKAGSTMFNEIIDGWGRMAKIAKETIDFTNNLYDEKEVQEWRKQKQTVKLHSNAGEDVDVSITVPEIMSLYNSMKREQAMKHIRAGGIKITGAGTDHFAVSQENLNALAATLTDRQRAVADALQKYAQEKGSELGNAVTMERWGIKCFGEKNYWPIETDSTDRNADGAVDNTNQRSQSLYRIMNMGFTKPLQKKATNALVVRDVFDVFANHMADMAKYNGLTMPMLDMMKWYNYREKTDVNGSDSGQFLTNGVQRAIEKAYGKGATGYFINFMKDMNGSNEGGRGEGFFKSVISNYKVAQIGFNLRVVIQQPTSIARASVMMDPKYLLEGIFSKGGHEEMMEHSGIAVWKIGLGFYDVNINNSMRNQIKHAETTKDKIQNASTYLAGKADEVTWTAMWRACRAEQADRGLTGDELMEATTKRFEQLMLRTQVMDSTISRSQNMRSGTVAMSEYTGFMSEPTLSYNVLLDAYDRLRDESKKNGWGEAWKKEGKNVTRTMTVFLMTSALTSAVAAIADAARDDDDYESWMQKWSSHALENYRDNANPIGLLPIVSDAYEFAKYKLTGEGYSNSSMTLAGLEKLTDFITLAYKKLTGTYNGNITDYGVLYKGLQAMGMLTGSPIAPILREITAFYNGGVTIYNDVWGNRLGERAQYWRTYEESAKTQIKSALENGYMTEEEAQSELVEQGIVDSEQKAQQQTYKWGNDVDSVYETMKAAIRNKEPFDMAAFTEEMAGIGIDENTVKTNVKSAIKTAYQDKTVNFTAADAKSALMTYLGMSGDDADAATEYWFFQTDNPAYKDWSQSTYENFKEVQDYGVTAEQFDTYNGKKAQCKGTDANGDGKTDSGSKKAEIMAVINQLPISSAAKDKLYYQNGWAQSTINEAPWH